MVLNLSSKLKRNTRLCPCDINATRLFQWQAQRTIVLSLKLAEIELIKQARGEYPVLLLDDVLSELDDDRQHILMSYIKDKVQTILTTATIKGLKLHQLPHAEIFYISAGNISKGEHYDGTKASTPTV